MINVLLADDHSIVREGLKRIIDDADKMKVVAEAADGREAIESACQTKPDVAVIDLSMPGIDGLEVIGQLQIYLPDLPILVLTMHEEDQYIIRSIAAGAAGYLTKRSAPELLAKAIQTVFSGKRFLDDRATEALASHISRGKDFSSPLDSLTNREIQVLKCLALGQTNREIAASYNISVKTVDTHRQRLLNKLNLRNNAELSRFAVQTKLVDL
jgi:two-component system, NarL family, invasion response regulator UvrY